MPNGRSRGRRRGRRPKRRSDEKGGRTVQTAAPALFAFMGPASSSVGLSAWRWAFASPHFGSKCFRSGQRKAIIRTHHRLEIGSDYIGLSLLTLFGPSTKNQIYNRCLGRFLADFKYSEAPRNGAVFYWMMENHIHGCPEKPLELPLSGIASESFGIH